MNIPGPSRVEVPEPFRGDLGRTRSSGLTTGLASRSPYSTGTAGRSPYSTTSRASSTSR